MEKSESIKELATALCKAQSKMKSAKKDSNNTFRESKFASLYEVIEAAKSTLHENGLSFSQFPISKEPEKEIKTTIIRKDGTKIESILSYVGVETILMHESGEWMKQELFLSCENRDPQSYGSAISYARRYAIQAILGIPSEDDDGNAAMPKRINSQPQNAQYKTVANKCKCGNDIWGTYPRCRECNQKVKNEPR